MTEQEANRLRKIFEESEIFQYYRETGDKLATKHANTSLRMKFSGEASRIGKIGGDNTSIEHLTRISKIAAKNNLESGQVHDTWIPAGHAKVQEMIESGEWSEIASKGWEGIKDKEAARENMRNAQKLSKTPEAKKKNHATKSKNRIKREDEFFNQLSDTFTNKEWTLIVEEMGRSRKWGQRIVAKRATKVSWDGRIQVYRKNET